MKTRLSVSYCSLFSIVGNPHHLHLDSRHSKHVAPRRFLYVLHTPSTSYCAWMKWQILPCLGPWANQNFLTDWWRWDQLHWWENCSFLLLLWLHLWILKTDIHHVLTILWRIQVLRRCCTGTANLYAAQLKECLTSGRQAIPTIIVTFFDIVEQITQFITLQVIIFQA